MTTSQKLPNRWLVAIMGTLLQLALGTVYAWSYFQKPMMAKYGWSNTQAAWVFSLAILFLSFAATWGGINLPKFGPRKLAVTGGLLFSAGYFIGAYALSIANLPLLYLGYGVIGGIGLGLGYVTPVATAAKWFPDKKGLVTGMVVMGFGFGALIMSKVLGPQFMKMTNDNLVLVFMYSGVILLVVTQIAAAFLTNPPAGYVPEGYTPPAVSKSDAGAQDSMTASQCLLSGKFAMMWTIFFFNIIAGIMFISFQSPLLQDLIKAGMPASTNFTDPAVVKALAASGATLIAISSIFNGLGRMFWGGLADKIGRIQAFRLIIGSQVVVFVALLFVKSPLIFSVLVCYVLLCYGGGFGSMPGYIADVFGPKLMATVYGTVLTAWGFGGVVGPQIVAYFKDNYPQQAAQYTFSVAAGILFVGLLISLALNNKKFIPAGAEEKVLATAK
ncbi:OFA family MFS transporter [Geomonas sp. RF6]|uniref:L-lactate MFS transporter n=1 Tax=Geomonas sp. RF6 TaxID=2897342 RepID=UPI001E35FB3D|nr:OFA family MFS transporter [Geomonas sp. RF6]UFS68532.1 OFA family MFS transporter [Geomonas sp. RF6]